MRIFTLVFAIAAGSTAIADVAFASKRCAAESDHITVMGVRFGLAAKPNPVLIEIDLDNPPAWFSDPQVDSIANLAGHHDIVGVALDRNVKMPMQSASRYNNFENAVASWLHGPDAPEALCGFRGFARHMSNGLPIYAPKVVAKDGFGNEIRMSFDRNTGEMTIREIVDSNGHYFPSHFDENAVNLEFLNGQPGAMAYAGLLENSGIRVSYANAKNASPDAKWQVGCERNERLQMTCRVHGE